MFMTFFSKIKRILLDFSELFSKLNYIIEKRTSLILITVALIFLIKLVNLFDSQLLENVFKRNLFKVSLGLVWGPLILEKLFHVPSVKSCWFNDESCTVNS